MALKITCPHCGTIRRLSQPYPLPGNELQCDGCGRGLTITYPKGMVDQMRGQGVDFDDPFAPRDSDGRPQPVPAPAIAQSPPSHPRPGRRADPPPLAAPPGPLPPDPSSTGPYAAVNPPFTTPLRPPDGRDTTVMERPGHGPDDETERLHARPSRPNVAGREDLPREPTVGRPPRASHGPASTRRKRPAPKRRRSRLGLLVRTVVVLCLLAGLAGGGLFAWVVHHYGQDLPTVDALATYRPPTVTVVNDRNGKLLGEIYEKRRYVVPLDQIPKQVQDAFIAAEDANFWTHGGIDYEGILRAVGRNAVKGRKAQGASTITQQVARNFLLTSDKTYERKIREVLLSRRIEEVFDKSHILYLYLNQIYPGQRRLRRRSRLAGLLREARGGPEPGRGRHPGRSAPAPQRLLPTPALEEGAGPPGVRTQPDAGQGAHRQDRL